MAITIDSSPAANSLLTDNLDYIFMMDDVGDGINTKKYMKYRILKGSTAVTDWMIYHPVLNKKFPINVRDTAKRHINTEIPAFQTGALNTVAVEQVDMVATFKIEYIELTKDLTSVDPATEGASANSAEVVVVNSADNFWKDVQGAAQTKALTNRPCRLKMWEGAEDWFYIYCVDNVEVNFAFFNNNGFIITSHTVSITHTGAGKVYRFNWGPKNILTEKPQANKYVMYITKNTGSPVLGDLGIYQVEIEGDDEDAYVIFQERAGGYASMTFKLEDKNGTASDVRSAKYAARTNQGGEAIRLLSGSNIVSKESNLILNMRKSIDAYTEMSDWLLEFVHSKSYIVSWRGVTVKGLLVPGTFNFGNDEAYKEFTCQIEILPEVIAPNHLR